MLLYIVRDIYFVCFQGEIEKSIHCDAFIVMYSVIDKASFQKAEDELSRLQDLDLLRSSPAILVGNKVDLVRSRAVSSQGMTYSVSNETIAQLAIY